MSEEHPPRRALVVEGDPFVSERLRYMMRAEGLGVCAVDEWPLFRDLAAQHSFDLFAASAALAERPDALELLRKLQPLLLLGSETEASAIGRLRMALPGATLVDRSLRDPDAVRRALGSAPPAFEASRAARGPEPSPQEWLRAAFESFGLSERQLEVLGRALRGETSRSMAAGLYISEATVRNHLHAIYERLGVSGRTELLGRFVQGLIEPGFRAERGTRPTRPA
jgi:DNA-binding CsgD family transcriptional regulator